MKIKQNLDAILYEKIRDALAAGVYRAGQRISFDELCALYEVSRTPVVQAVKLLAGEGVLDILPNGKFCVPSCTSVQIAEICDARVMLERFAIERICQSSDAAAIAWLERITRQMEAYCAKGDLASARKEDLAFHRALVAACENACVIDLYTRVEGRFLLMSAPLGVESVQSQLKIAGDHAKLIQQLRSFETAAAVETITQHAAALRDRLCALCEA